MAVIGSSAASMEDALNIRPGMMIRYEGTPPQTVAPLPQDHWEKVLAEQAAQVRMSIAMQANLQNQRMDNLMGLGANAYANAYRPPQEPTTADKLNAWYARLEERVAQIEADDAVMGKKETKRWMDELAAFKADLS